MQITGQIKKIYQTTQVTDSFKKRDFVVTTQEQYPQDIIVQMVQDKCDVLNGYKVGDLVEVSINIRGKEYIDKNSGEARYFNTVQGWRIENRTAPAATSTNDFPAAPENFAPPADDGDLPF